MQVAILGSGEVGRTLAAGFARHGHDVTIGTRDPSKLSAWSDENSQVAIAKPSDAVREAELVVLAVKGTTAEEALSLAGAENLEGKTVIDATNPIADDPPENGVLKFFTSLDKSLMERLQESVPAANFVKCFNSVGNAFMVDPDFGEEKPTMFICGNDADAKRTVEKILEEFGWESVDMGTAEAARAIEPLCILWCIPGFLRNEWSHAFRLLRAN